MPGTDPAWPVTGCSATMLFQLGSALCGCRWMPLVSTVLHLVQAVCGPARPTVFDSMVGTFPLSTFWLPQLATGLGNGE
jgi:hypothetical protein